MTVVDHSKKLFRLSSGGLSHRIQRRVTGGRGELPLPLLFLASVSLMWLPLVVLTLISGSLVGEGVGKPFLRDIGPYARFLVALPLLLIARTIVDPGIRVAMSVFETAGVIPEDRKSRYEAAVSRLEQRRDAVWPEFVMLLLAFGFTWLFRPGYGDSILQGDQTTWLWSDSDRHLSLAGWWYALVSAPLFQFILFRWIWRYLIWAVFLWQVSRIGLALRPTHPDRAGGLGPLGLAQQSFSIVFVAFAAVLSSTLAHNILSGASTLEATRPEVVALTASALFFVYTPLLCFAKQLLTAKRRGLSEYTALGQRLSGSFHDRWVKDDSSDEGTALMDSADASAMADFAATYGIVQGMRVIPVTIRGVVSVAALLVLPYLPLYLTEFSLSEFLHRIATALV